MAARPPPSPGRQGPVRLGERGPTSRRGGASPVVLACARAARRYGTTPWARRRAPWPGDQ